MTELLIETNFKNVVNLSEAKSDGTKEWYIEGIFAQADVVNRNGRVYPSEILNRSMNAYNIGFVMKNRGVGEAEHPNTTKVNLDRISHVIVPGSLVNQGSNWSAKAKILNTPCGNLVKGLLEGGVQIGVSTRAGGSVIKNSRGVMEVQDNLTMSAIDIVFSPSAPDAMVAGLMEGVDFVWNSIDEMDREILQSLKEDLDTNKKYKLAEERLKTFNKMMKIIKGSKLK